MGTRKIKELAGGSYYHFGIAYNVRQQLDAYPQMKGLASLALEINIDGLPLFKSSSKQFWPILAILKGISHSTGPFVIGLFCGDVKPTSLDEYIADIVQEMQSLRENGVRHDGKTYGISIENFICDAPAKAFIKHVKSHNGYAGCDKCVQHGVHNKRMLFPESDAELRTYVAFDEMNNEEHQKGPSPLTQIGICMVTQVPLDYKHLVCLGVMKKLLLLWVRGPLKCRIGPQAKLRLSGALLSLGSYIPKNWQESHLGWIPLKGGKQLNLDCFFFILDPLLLQAELPKKCMITLCSYL